MTNEEKCPECLGEGTYRNEDSHKEVCEVCGGGTEETRRNYDKEHKDMVRKPVRKPNLGHAMHLLKVLRSGHGDSAKALKQVHEIVAEARVWIAQQEVLVRAYEEGFTKEGHQELIKDIKKQERKYAQENSK